MQLKVVGLYNELEYLNWRNSGDADTNTMIFHFFKGVFNVYIPALLLWVQRSSRMVTP